MVPHQAQYTKHHGFEGVAEIRRLDAHLPILDPELHVICHAADGDAEGLFGDRFHGRNGKRAFRLSRWTGFVCYVFKGNDGWPQGSLTETFFVLELATQELLEVFIGVVTSITKFVVDSRQLLHSSGWAKAQDDMTGEVHLALRTSGY
ncbi:hypothetical protein PG990_014544 [Apiospora arundinis]